jgi:hypothetical protein
MTLSAYGYVRIRAGMPEDNAKEGPLRALNEYAEHEGYVLTDVFTEREDSGSSAFAALIDTLKVSEQPVVIVPALCHFAHLPGLRAAMKDRIERETGARVIVVDANGPDDPA